MNRINILLFCGFLFFCSTIIAQEIPTHQVIKTENLAEFLKENVKEQISKDGVITQKELAAYLREKYSERFFYDWHTFQDRFVQYNQMYNSQSSHENRAKDHMQKFADSTQWLLPFNYLNGKEVNAYALRHLARQHKMVDIAFQYFYDHQDPKYIQYFVRQMRSLNTALESGQYDKIEDGNGVYEVFRSGYRVLNWLGIHNMFLGEEAYTDQDQLCTVATLLQHGAHLYDHNPSFRPGNHQTRGMSALAMLSIILRDFEGTDQWYLRAMKRLEEHLSKEINEDGFQFERSVHYHMSDISNYFYVYQLAKISGIEISKVWEEKLRSLFTTLAMIAYPDKTAPVLQDDTEIPWAEKNDISGMMTLGYLLFEDPEFGYFANNKVASKMYWFLPQNQLDQLKSISREKPQYGSLTFPITHYYVMREGWDQKDNMMVISAGLDAEKPDHQHGDMLGIQAIANGQAILPNYQVRYSLKDFELFKNSMVKNVALVDEELQGKEWTSNKGGSGFGKFKKLPNPSTITWQSNKDFDLFVGSHDGFEDVGVAYTRQVVYVKNDFWIVKDNFQSNEPHVYKQVWQGHYTSEHGPHLLRSTFDDASGCDILQLNKVDEAIGSGARGKEWMVVAKNDEKEFDFVTVIFPYARYDNRIDEEAEDTDLKGWILNQSKWKMEGDQPIAISKNGASFFFGVNKLTFGQVEIALKGTTDLYLKETAEQLNIQLIGDTSVEVSISGTKAGKLNGTSIGNQLKLSPGDQLISQIIK